MAENTLEIDFFLAHIFNLLRPRGFALDGDGAGVAETVQFVEDLEEVDQASADQDLLTEFVGIGRPSAILGMNAADMRAKDVDRINRIGLSVENQIGRVETNREILHVHIANHARHGRGSLLSSFHKEILSIFTAVLGDRANGLHGLRIERVGGVFGDKAAMRLDLRDAEQFGKIRNLAQCVDARPARGWRNKSDGRRAAQEVPNQWLRTYNLDGCCNKPELIQ